MLAAGLRNRIRKLVKGRLSLRNDIVPGHSRTQWSIGIYAGPSPFELSSPPEITNPVLTYRDINDVPAGFLADPFMLRVDGTWNVFFELKNRATRKGEIGLAVSRDGKHWQYRGIVLAEPFHLSYPYVFEWNGQYFMAPETSQARDVRLYQAVDFPTKWSLWKTIFSNGVFLDSSIFRHEDCWWMFTETNPAFKFDTLRLFHADELAGPWTEHKRSPIIQGNGHIARPAGRVLALDDAIVRYAQDCDPVYGARVRAFIVRELSRSSYQEKEASPYPIVDGTGSGWNATGMHHIDAHKQPDGQWMACVDGWFSQDL